VLENKLKVLLFLLFSLQAYSVPVGTIEKNLKSYQCLKSVNKLTKGWIPKGEWKGYLTGNGSIGLKRPTQKFAHWINLEKYNDKEAVSLINPNIIQKFIFDPSKKCKAQLSTFKHNQYANTRGMNDSRLMKEMMDNEKGLIVMWSPKMQHSFNAIKRLKKIAKEKGLAIHYVLDPFVNPKTARKALKKRNIKLKSFYSLSSLELVQREAMMHYPAFFTYKNGKIVGRILPGLMTEEFYKKHIDKRLF
jgi:hypothetical protein